MKRNFRVLFAAITILVLALVLTASIAGAGQADPATAGVASITATAAEQSAAASHWTREARLAAKPLELSGVTPEQLAAGIAAMDAAAPSGPAGFAPGSLPRAGADASAQQDFAADWAALEAEAAAAAANPAAPLAPSGNPGVYTAYYTNQFAQMWKYYPYRAVGKLFFNAGFCSASVIGPNTIVTAAHCVYNTDNNTWYTNWSFCPAYKSGNCPYGTYAWQQAWVLTNYINSPSWAAAIRYDVAVIQLRTNAAGQQVQNLTGTLGRSWNFPFVQLIHTNGYPAAKQGGNIGYMCVAESFQSGTEIMEMGCNSGPGHSGGPWIKNFTPYVAGAVNYVNNVMSYYYTSGTKAGNTMGAARFSSSNIVILCNSAPGC